MGAWVSSTSWLRSPGDGGFASDENKSSFSFSLVPAAVGLQQHPTQSTHTHTRAHARTHTRACAHTHTHAQMHYGAKESKI